MIGFLGWVRGGSPGNDCVVKEVLERVASKCTAGVTFWQEELGLFRSTLEQAGGLESVSHTTKVCSNFSFA